MSGDGITYNLWAIALVTAINSSSIIVLGLAFIMHLLDMRRHNVKETT